MAPEVDKERIIGDALAERAKPATYAYPALVAVVALSTSYLGREPTSLAAVIGAGVLVGAVRAVVLHARHEHWVSRERWRFAFRASALVAALVWALGTAACLSRGLDANAIVVLMTTAGIASGATSALSPDLPLQRAYVLVLLGPVVLGCAVTGTPQGVGAAIATTMFLAYLLVVGAAAARQLTDSIARLAFEQNVSRGHETRAKLLSDARLAAEHAEAEARAASRSKSAFLANMSHEIRTPMTAVLGYAELLSDPDVGSADRAEYADILRKNGDHLLRLLNDVLDLSKIEAGKLSVELAPCHLGRIFSEIDAVAGMRAEEKNIRFLVDIVSPIPELVLSDATRLKQVLLNLAGNAIKFTDTGTVTLRAAFSSSDDGDDGTLTLAIVDTGVGMAESECVRVFEPFVQADSSSTRRHDGVGLGLAISSHIVRLLGGKLSVSSELGKGSTFSVELTTRSLTRAYLSGKFAAAVRESGVVEVRPLEGKSVLLAEDSDDNLRLLSMFLRRAGATLDIATNGAEALELARVRAYDVVLMDMQMPVLDGYAAVAALRSEGYAGRIIALTANALVEDRQRCLDAGCDAHAAKPISRRRLVDVVHAQIYGDGVEPAARERDSSESVARTHG